MVQEMDQNIVYIIGYLSVSNDITKYLKVLPNLHNNYYKNYIGIKMTVNDFYRKNNRLYKNQ